MSSSKVLTIFLFVVTIGMLLTLEGCGGGSAGTGFDTQGKILTLEGALVSETEEPLSGVTITVADTGEKAVTDSAGVFSIDTSRPAGEALLVFERGAENGTTVVPVNEDESSLQLVITLTPTLTTVEDNSFTMTSRISGECSTAFSETSPIQQLQFLESNKTCSASVQISSESKSTLKTPFAIQYRGCSTDSPWVTLSLGETNTEAPDGGSEGTVDFPFNSDEARCVYRIVAPFNIDSATLVAKEIQTVTFLARTAVF